MIFCPSHETLQKLLQGELPPTDNASLRAHLDQCESCLEILDRLSDDPDIESWLAGAEHGPNLAARQAVLDRLADAIPQRPNPSDQSWPLTSLGPYELLSEIGRGGMGVVYRARDRNMNRIVALKVLGRDLADERARARFLREASAAGRVEHDHVVRVYATSDPAERVLYFAMEYVDGPSLAGLIQSQARLDPRRAATVVAQAADGLAAAHALGLIHRDVKPDKLLIDAVTGRAKIGDFGLARLIAADVTLTREGVIAGTPAYLCPEQAHGDAAAGPLADVYALGITLYECLTGEPPFRGTPNRVIHQILHDDPRPPRSINEAIPRDLETICLQAIAKEPARRYPTVAAFAADLRRWLNGEPIQARPVGPLGKLWRSCRRYPRVAALSTAFVLSLLGGISGIVWQWRRADANATRFREASVRAERSYRQAREAVDRFYTRMVVDRTLEKPGLEKVRTDIVNSMLDYYRQFLSENANDPTLRADAAEASARVGVMFQEMGDKRQGLVALGQARKLLEELTLENPNDVKFRLQLTICLDMTGHLLSELGRGDEALEAGLASCKVSRQVVELEPDNPDHRRYLGVGYGNMANTYSHLGKRTLALETYRLAREQQEILFRRDPSNLRDGSYLAMTLHNIALILDDPTEQVAYLRQALAIRRGLVEKNEGNEYFRRNAAITEATLASTLLKLSQASEAVTLSDHACESLREISKIYPANHVSRRDFANAIADHVAVLVSLNRPAEAIAVAEEGFRTLGELAKADPADLVGLESEARLRKGTAEAHECLNHTAEALRHRETRLEILDKLVHNLPDRADLCSDRDAERLATQRLGKRFITSRSTATQNPNSENGENDSR